MKMVRTEARGLNMPRLIYMLIIAVLLAGIVAGWLAASLVPEYGRLLEGLGVHINIISDMESADPVYFVERAVKYAAPLTAMWFLAFLPPAAAFVPFFVFFKGAGLGLATKALWDLNGAGGFKLAAALYLPQNLLLAPVVCFIAADSICQALGAIRAQMIMSAEYKTAGGTMPGMRLSSKGGKPGYAGKLAAAVVCALAAAAWEAWVTPLIIRSIR
ncbi:MAG: stage II sporulation protein M [Clostridiales bacterium]|jgi:hypothetical protein|nr:stage II sporulation protein M [Clostridiales bacterium]